MEQTDVSGFGLAEERLNVDQSTTGFRLLVRSVDPLDAGKERISDEDGAGVVLRVLDQLIHAIDVEGSFSRQQRVPFLTRKVCLKPKHTKNARGIELSQALFEACCDEVQRYGSISP